ncbi:MAG: carboxypeptidase regulatory-like domain-containing protein [Chloroflexota bacterium]
MKKNFRILMVVAVLLTTFSSSFNVAASVQPQDKAPEFASQVYVPMVVVPMGPYQVSGRVLDSNSNPLPGATVTDKDGNTTTTDANGDYAMRVRAGLNSITVIKDEYVFEPAVLELNMAGDMTDQDFTSSMACVQGIGDIGFEAGGWWALGGGASYVNGFSHKDAWSAKTGLTVGPDVWGYSYVRTPLINIPAAANWVNLRVWVYTMTSEVPNGQLPSMPVGEKFKAPAPADKLNGTTSITTFDAQYIMVLDSTDAILEIINWNRRDDRVWQKRLFDLSKWAGSSIKIEIGVYSDGVDGVTAMYVDDVGLAICDAPLMIPSCSQQFVNPNFESVGTGWVSAPSAYPAQYTSSYAHSGWYAMRAGIPLESTHNVSSFSNVYQTVAIPALSTYARMNVWLYPQTEEPWTPSLTALSEMGGDKLQAPNGADAQYIYVIDAWNNYHYLLWEQASQNHKWINRQYDLTAFAGQTIRIVFGVYNDGFNGRTVMYVDDAYLDTCTGIVPPPTCELITNGGFESNLAWYAPATAYTAGYTSLLSHTGARSMRSGIYYLSHNTYSYSDFGQAVSIPLGAGPYTLTFYEYSISGDTGWNDVQYLLVLDIFGNWIDTLLWQRENDQWWEPVVIDLTPYAGWSLRLQWGTYNNGWGGVTSMTVDDVSLTCP